MHNKTSSKSNLNETGDAEVFTATSLLRYGDDASRFFVNSVFD